MAIDEMKYIELSNKVKISIKKNSMPRVQLFKENGEQITQPVGYPRFRKNVYQQLCAMDITREEVVKTLGELDTITNDMVLKK